jgi:RHS repeat-associated protein
VTQSVQNGHTTSYVYNIAARTRTVTYPGGKVITESTDPRSRIAQIDDAGSPPPIVQYTYDLADRVTVRSYPRNGTSSDYTYDTDNRIVALTNAFGATPFANLMYAYDNEGNKKYEQKLQDTTHSEAYLYDAAYRLINYAVGTLVGSSVPAPSTQTSYSLDPVGNWNSKTTNSVTQTRSYNADDELIKINSTNLTYSSDGNPLNDGTYAYTYDEENRLTKITRLSDSAIVGQYLYDAFSRRVQKVADPNGTSVTTRYFYDGTRVIEEQDGLGNTLATYVYGRRIDEVIVMVRAGLTYYYHQNALGSVIAITNSVGSPVERYSYDAYGLATVTNGAFTAVPPNAWGTPHSAIGNPWMFTSRRLDEEAGLYFYGLRYYDPLKGRYLQRAPVPYATGQNLYEYAKDNPLFWLN